MYYHHTGYPGGLKTSTFEKVIARHPTQPLENAIKGMLPKGPLGRKLAKNAKIYAGAAHPHGGQNPTAIDL
jgi:large subunit ribosomal protein L13